MTADREAAALPEIEQGKPPERQDQKPGHGESHALLKDLLAILAMAGLCVAGIVAIHAWYA